jgi:type I restriction enzyme S subunit
MAALDAATGRIESPETALVDSVGGHLRAFEAGDVLLAKISPSFENGKVAVARGLETEVGLGSTEFHVLRVGDELLADYLWLVLRRDAVRGHLIPTMSGRAGQQRIARSVLERLPIPLPRSRAEQRAVVRAALQSDEPYRTAVEHIEQARSATDTVREAILADATVSTEPWQEVRLSDLVPVDRPIRYGIVQPGPERPGGVPYIRVRDFRQGSIALDAIGHTDPAIAERHRAAMLHAGDLLVSIRGTIGEVARVPPELEGAHTTQDAARISGLDVALREWLALLLRSPYGQLQLRGLTSGRAVQGVSVTALRRLMIPVPAAEEMTRRVEIATKALAAVEESELTIDNAVALSRRIRETVTLAITLGHADVAALPLLPARERPMKPKSVQAVVEPTLEPVAVADTAPAIVQAVAQAGGRVDATSLLAQQKQLKPDVFYEQLWKAVTEGWLLEPPRGSSTLELADAP